MHSKAEARTRELEPFFLKLKKIHTVPKVTSYSTEQLEHNEKLRQHTQDLEDLQAYATAGMHSDYTRKLAELKDQGLTFRQTKGKIYLTLNEGDKVDVEVALQVKGNSLTWYFWAEGAMDQYPQEFRDRLYNQAAKCHKEVDAGCDLYYRGSNSFHLKNMHHVVTESGHNHNHYRLANDKHYTPHDFNQHLNAFKSSSIHDEFFDAGEIDDICEKFNLFYLNWTKKENNQPSQEEQYFAQESQHYNPADIIELRLFGTMQEPCRLRVDELKVDYEAARIQIEQAIGDQDPSLVAQALEAVKSEYETLLSYRSSGGVRGIGSSKASTRQPAGSGLAVEKEQVMDDSIGIEVPDIPVWATSIKKAVDTGKQAIIDSAKRRTSPSKEIPENDVALEWEYKQLQRNFKAALTEIKVSRGNGATDEDNDQSPRKK